MLTATIAEALALSRADTMRLPTTSNRFIAPRDTGISGSADGCMQKQSGPIQRPFGHRTEWMNAPVEKMHRTTGLQNAPQLESRRADTRLAPKAILCLLTTGAALGP